MKKYIDITMKSAFGLAILSAIGIVCNVAAAVSVTGLGAGYIIDWETSEIWSKWFFGYAIFSMGACMGAAGFGVAMLGIKEWLFSE